MTTNLSGKSVIAGIGATKFGALPGRSTISMNVEAIRKALADAGVEKDAVDALWVKCPTSKFELMYGQKIAEATGLQPRIGGVWDQGGASNIMMISYAVDGDRGRPVRDRGDLLRRQSEDRLGGQLQPSARRRCAVRLVRHACRPTP